MAAPGATGHGIGTLFFVRVDVQGRILLAHGSGLSLLAEHRELKGLPFLELFPESAGIGPGVARAKAGEPQSTSLELAGRYVELYFEPCIDGAVCVFGVVRPGLELRPADEEHQDVP